MIGSLGSVVFEVSLEQVKTFEDFSRDSSARYAKHDVLGIKPVKQFIGPGLDKIKFKIHLSAALGINPISEINNLRQYMQNGEALTLVIGEKPVGSGKYTVESINDTWTVVDNKGNVIAADVDVELEEYTADLPKTFIKTAPKTAVKSVATSKKTSKSIPKKKVVKKPKKQVKKKKVERKGYMHGTRMGGYEPID